MRRRNKDGKRAKNPHKTCQLRRIKILAAVAEVIVRIISVSASTMIKPLKVVLNKREKSLPKRRTTTTKENSTRTKTIKRKMELREAVVVVGVEAGAVATLIDPVHKVKSITITARESRPMEMKLETSAEDVEVEADTMPKKDRTLKEAVEVVGVGIISKMRRLTERLATKTDHPK